MLVEARIRDDPMTGDILTPNKALGSGSKPGDVPGGYRLKTYF